MARASVVLATVAAFGLAACGADTTPVAHVAGDTITRGQLKHLLKLDPSHRTAPAGSAQSVRDVNGALGQLIHFEWVRREAKAEGVTLSDAERKQFRKESAGDVSDREVEDFGLDEKLRGMVHRGVTASEVAAAYERVRTISGKRRDLLAVVTTSRADAMDARRLVAAGNSFASVADRYGSAWDDVVGTLPRGWILDLPATAPVPGFDPGAPLRKAVARRFTYLGGPVKSGRGWYVYKIIAVKDPLNALPRAEGMKRVAAELRGLRVSTAYEQKLSDHWLSKTSCEKGYVISGGVTPLGGVEGSYLSTAGCGNFVPFTTPAPAPG